jgi:hypothetical protein
VTAEIIIGGNWGDAIAVLTVIVLILLVIYLVKRI